MAGIEFGKQYVWMGSGEGTGASDGRHVVVKSMEDPCRLYESGCGRKFEGVFDEGVIDAPNPPVAMMEDVDMERSRLPDVFLPAARETEGRGQKDKPRYLRMRRGVKRGEESPHTRPDQADGFAANRAFEEAELAGNREVLEIAPIHRRYVESNASLRKSGLEPLGLARLRAGRKAMDV